MATYDVMILGADALAALMAERAVSEFGRVVWIRDLPDSGFSGQVSEDLPACERLWGAYQFRSENAVLCLAEEAELLLASEQIVLACGANPRRPGWMIEHPRVLLSNELHRLPAFCQRVAIVGMGETGARVFAFLQGRTRLIQCLDAQPFEWPLPLSQDLPADVLTQTTSLFSPGNAVIGLEAQGHEVVIYLEDGQFLASDAVVVCCGSQGKTQTCNLAAAGLSADDRGRLWCNDDYQTWTPGIFAIGAVVGYPRPLDTPEIQVRKVLQAMKVNAGQLQLT